MLEFIVLNVMLQNIGMQHLKDVLPVSQDTPGMKLKEFAHVVNYQDKSSELIVYVHHQKHSGMPPQRPAHAPSTLSVSNVNHAQLQDNGITEQTSVNAHYQQMYGTELNVCAQLENSDQTVLNAQPQDIGILPATNVSVTLLTFGTDHNVFAHLDTLIIKEDVPDAQTDSIGKTTNVKLVHAPTRI